MKRLTKTVLSSVTVASCLVLARVALAYYSPDESGLTTAASALYGQGSGVQSDISDIVGAAVNAVLGLVGAFFLVLIIYSGSLWMTSRGNQDQIKRAQNTMTSAVIGIIIVMGAYSITGFVINQILGATGAGGEVTDVVPEASDAANRPDLELNTGPNAEGTCTTDSPAYKACMEEAVSGAFQDKSMAEMDRYCMTLCNNEMAADAAGEGESNLPDTCDMDAYEACLDTNSPPECLVLAGCSADEVTKTPSTPQEIADCWNQGDCKTKPYNDAECTINCGGGRPVAMSGQSGAGSTDCVTECITKYKRPPAVCDASCTGSNPNPNPEPGWLDCVEVCKTTNNNLTDAECEQQCTGVEGTNPLVSTTCYSECYASGLPYGTDAKIYFCNKSCLNPDAVDAAVNQTCWTQYLTTLNELNRMKKCLVDNVCMTKCAQNGHNHSTCIDDCALGNYD
jgi:hypothetical protein